MSGSKGSIQLDYEVSKTPRSSRIELSRKHLPPLSLAVGKPALLRFTSTDATAAVSWSTGAVWLREDAASISSTPRKRIVSQPVVEPIRDATIPLCLLPSMRQGDEHRLKVEAFPADSLAKVAQAVEIHLELLERWNRQCQEVNARTLDRQARQVVSLLAKELLIELGYVVSGQKLVVSVQGSELVLRISMPGSAPLSTPAEAQASIRSVDRATIVSLNIAFKTSGSTSSSPPQANGAASPEAGPSTSRRQLGGLQEEMKQLQELVYLPLMRPELFEDHGLQPPRGVLLHGPPGTGKTSLALSLSSSFLPASSIFTISGPELSSSYHGRTEARIRKVFRAARRKGKAVIIIDEIDVIASNRESEDGGGGIGSRVVATLLTEIDGVGQEYRSRQKEGARAGQGRVRSGQDQHESQGSSGSEDEEDGGGPRPSRIVVIAATNRPNVLDPALRRPGRLDREIEIGVPTPAARLDILETLLVRTPHALSEDDLQHVANRTHGFVGADLSALVREAGMKVIRRRLDEEQAAQAGPSEDLSTGLSKLQLAATSQGYLLTSEDLLSSVAGLRPSSLRSMLPPPPLPWSAIGLGSPDSPYSKIKQSILQCVEWPLKYPHKMAQLGIAGSRGVLLYGPPGCSKTMLARACAQSQGINWMSIKGPELFSKYLGDSEKALRELFRKARQASPTIVFFDEIDALTTTRSQGGGENAVADRVIATLLTELDGVEGLEKVVVIAATNRPEVIDPALLRPGRLDTHLYVGPPDYSARLSILELRTKAMSLPPGGLKLNTLADLTDGCSGAEVASLCHRAGVLAMSESMEAEYVKQEHFEEAARGLKRGITREMLQKYEVWKGGD